MPKVDRDHLAKILAIVDTLPNTIEGQDAAHVVARNMIALEDAYVGVGFGLSLGLSMEAIKRRMRESLEGAALCQDDSTLLAPQSLRS